MKEQAHVFTGQELDKIKQTTDWIMHQFTTNYTVPQALKVVEMVVVEMFRHIDNDSARELNKTAFINSIINATKKG